MPKPRKPVVTLKGDRMRKAVKTMKKKGYKSNPKDKAERLYNKPKR